jgi:hypothetical protein
VALYSRREFAELCGLTWSDSVKSKVAMWIKRGNVIESDGKIDDSLARNRDWALKQKETSLVKAEEVQVISKKETPKKAKSDDSDGLFSIEKQLKSQNLKKLEVDTRIQLLKEEKIRGEVVPIELIKSLFRTHNQSILTASKDGLEEILINFSQEGRLSGEKVALLRGKMTRVLNSCFEKAIETTKRQMKSVIDEYSIKKEVGERE